MSVLTIREQTWQLEENSLSPHASLSRNTKGRDRPVGGCDLRTDYQRDRDRIIHCKSFRRLMNKTQVFLSPEGDHYRTRLTHTLEVNQIARTIARALRLNEDLVEAISLGHDLGHTPFGHAGEDVLNEVCPHGFVHSEQSVRVVETLEQNGRGLNLTWEVRDGIRCHSHAGEEAATLEGRLVRYADKIAYMNHDIDDAVRAGMLLETDVPWNVRMGLGRNKSERITTLVQALVDSSGADIQMDEPHQKLYDELRAFLFEAVYTNPGAKREENKAKDVIRRLYEWFAARPEQLPAGYHTIVEESGIDRAVCDYISGMSDRYCIAVFDSLFVPKSWSV